MLVSWFLFLLNFGSESECLNLACKVLEKLTFPEVGVLTFPGSFLIGLGTHFHDFGGLGTGFKFDGFS